MIKKSLRAYISRHQLVFLILPHGEVIRLPLSQLLEGQIHIVLKGLIILRASMALMNSMSVAEFCSSSGAS